MNFIIITLHVPTTLQVIFKALYNQSSSRDHGTLGHFRSLLSRLSVTSNTKKDVNATVDLLMTVYKGHLLACACKVLGIKKLTDRIDIPDTIFKGSQKQQQAYVSIIAAQVVDEMTLIEDAYRTVGVVESGDGVYNYARILCHFCTLLMDFMDAWAEGDGERIYTGWRLFFPHLYAAHRTKYSLEALRLQFQVQAVLSPHLAHHIKWDRFVNKTGGSGMNIPCDLHNEHVNKLIKEVIQHMGANLTEGALQRVARSVSTLETICKCFDAESGVPIGTHAHSTRSDSEDVEKVMKVVLDNDLLATIPGRKHQKFPNIHGNPLWNWDRTKMEEWVEKKKNDFLKFNTAGGEGNQSDSDVTDDEDDEDDD